MIHFDNLNNFSSQFIDPVCAIALAKTNSAFPNWAAISSWGHVWLVISKAHNCHRMYNLLTLIHQSKFPVANSLWILNPKRLRLKICFDLFTVSMRAITVFCIYENSIFVSKMNCSKYKWNRFKYDFRSEGVELWSKTFSMAT